MMAAPRTGWDIGTAYDLFISLNVLHEPGNFGLRAAWAAGMRSRLPAPDREFLESAVESVLSGPPLGWVYQLPAPKDATTALEVLEEIPAAQRLAELTINHDGEVGPTTALYLDVAKRGEWTEQDRETLPMQGESWRREIAC